ncbi:MAG: sigma-54-dependent Fis family transcriptional regulator [Syntrophus sp. (in: bacteria)]|nr:sigma-54-dependent Fis family transcriptional regulator [Syntrophus sp. (in: bacteria)]
MLTYSIYIVDDEQTIREGITMALEAEYRMTAFATAETANAAIMVNPPDLVLLDIGLPDMNGIEVLRKIKDLHPDVLVIMVTAYEDLDSVIAAMRLGAYDYVVKPIHMESLELIIRNALETIRLRKEVQLLQETYLKQNLPCFIGESNIIHGVMEFIGMVAKSPDTPILVYGETGTGKELIAGAIHYRSPNFRGPLITVNCASLPKDLVESELFGYEKGAFSGASASGKKGLVEEAQDGTLFLDEVGDLSQEAQAKLLRFLETGEFYRIGGTKKFQVQTRVVSATNKDLVSMIEKGLFRKDLYFRLSVVKIDVPSLSERKDDIIPLAKHFLMQLSHKFNKKFTAVSPQAERALRAHPWTGNVRELLNIIERAVLIGTGPELTLQDLVIKDISSSPEIQARRNEAGFPPLTPTGIDLSSVQEQMEAFYIREALHLAKGNESKAARLLNLNHHTFRYRRKKLRVE